MTTYEQKIDQVKSIISEHNKLAKNKIPVDEFIEKLMDSGGTTDEALKVCLWEDLEKCGLPSLIAKQVVGVFRHDKDQKPIRRLLTEARVQAMSVAELLDCFDFRNHDNAVGKRLREISQGKRCLVFDQRGNLHQPASTTLVDELREGYPERDIFLLDDRPSPTFRVGEHPEQYAHENPLFPDRLLRSDETCDQTNRSWRGIGDEVRVVLNLAKTRTKELRIESVDDAHAAMDLVANSKDPTMAVRRRYAKASVMYDQLKQEGTLPSLRKRKGGGGSANDPFFGNNKKF